MDGPKQLHPDRVRPVKGHGIARRGQPGLSQLDLAVEWRMTPAAARRPGRPAEVPLLAGTPQVQTAHRRLAAWAAANEASRAPLPGSSAAARSRKGIACCGLPACCQCRPSKDWARDEAGSNPGGSLELGQAILTGLTERQAVVGVRRRTPGLKRDQLAESLCGQGPHLMLQEDLHPTAVSTAVRSVDVHVAHRLGQFDCERDALRRWKLEHCECGIGISSRNRHAPSSAASSSCPGSMATSLCRMAMASSVSLDSTLSLCQCRKQRKGRLSRASVRCSRELLGRLHPSAHERQRLGVPAGDDRWRSLGCGRVVQEGQSACPIALASASRMESVLEWRRARWRKTSSRGRACAAEPISPDAAARRAVAQDPNDGCGTGVGVARSRATRLRTMGSPRLPSRLHMTAAPSAEDYSLGKGGPGVQAAGSDPDSECRATIAGEEQDRHPRQVARVGGCLGERWGRVVAKQHGRQSGRSGKSGRRLRDRSHSGFDQGRDPA